MCFERRTWAHLTGVRAGSASLLEEIAREESEGSTTWDRGEYPTPSATRYGSSQNEGEVPHDRPSRGTPSLDTWAAKQWATPRASANENRTTKNAPTHGVSHGLTLAGQAGSLWQTPATDSFRSRGGDRKDEPGLDQQARHWPTPVKADGERGSDWNARREGNPTLVGAAKHWPTPTSFSKASEGVNRPGNNRSANKTLGIVENWPTPTAGDAKASGLRNTENSEAHAGVSLSDMVTTGDSAGRRDRTTPKDGSDGPLRAVLNPSFVETLQGFKVDWTDCVVSGTR